MAEPERPDEQADETGRRFVDDLVVRGEIVPKDSEPLPPGATHEVEEERDGVPAKVLRRRFSTN
jgi:hypothetical protein